MLINSQQLKSLSVEMEVFVCLLSRALLLTTLQVLGITQSQQCLACGITRAGTRTLMVLSPGFQGALWAPFNLLPTTKHGVDQAA